MKPRNKYEQRVAELNGCLSEDIAIRDFEWAKKETFSTGVDMGGANYVYFTICSNMEEFEVKRLYRLYRFTDKNTSHFFVTEIMREFFYGDKHTYFSKRRFGMGCSSFDCFSLNSDITLTDNRKNYAGNMIAWLIDYSIGSHVQSSGKRMKCEKRDCREIGRIVMNNPVAETMYKESNLMFEYLMYRTHLKNICRAYTIAKRHGFVFNEETIPLWLDMVKAIIVCKKDWHNPVYVAPADLRATHDRFIRMMIRKQQHTRLEMEYEKIQREIERNKDINEKYIKRRKRFYDMVLTDGLIECRVLRDVNAFREEGETMEHCVFKCRYFEKPYSLILSARIGGERVETIEVDLTTYTIAQCYGKRDHFTMYHDRIKELVNSQMETIKYYNRNRRTIKKSIAV